MKYILIIVFLFLLNISPALAISVDLQFISLELPNGFINETWQGEDTSGGRIISTDRNIIVDYYAGKLGLAPHIDKGIKDKYRILGNGKKDSYLYYYAVEKNNLLVSLGKVREVAHACCACSTTPRPFLEEYFDS